jgi:hypothetical protein
LATGVVGWIISRIVKLMCPQSSQIERRTPTDVTTKT